LAVNRVRSKAANGAIVLVLVVAYLATLALATAMIGSVWPGRNPEPVGGFVRITGVVEATNPSQHNEVRYRYAVAGRTYEGAWFADGPEGDAAHLRIGQTITVWYEAARPSLSCSCVDPHDMLQTNTDTTPQLFGAFLVLTVGFLGLAGRLLYGSWFSIFAAARRLASTQVRAPSQLEPNRHDGGRGAQ